jgi:hypothetical protein
MFGSGGVAVKLVVLGAPIPILVVIVIGPLVALEGNIAVISCCYLL